LLGCICAVKQYLFVVALRPFCCTFKVKIYLATVGRLWSVCFSPFLKRRANLFNVQGRSSLGLHICIFFIIAKVGHALRLIEFCCASKSLLYLPHVRNSLILSLFQTIFSILHLQFELLPHVLHKVFALI